MISIIVPVYNSEKTLKRCIESLIKQSYKNIEIIIVIDGSTDNSEHIAAKYAEDDLRIKLIVKDNEGVSEARNTGIKNSKGDYILFIDSDDYIENNMCEKLLDAVEKHSAQMAVCGYHHLFMGNDILKCPNAGACSLDEFSDEFLWLYGAGFLNMPWNKLFKRELIEEYFDKSLSLGEDLLFNIAYMKNIERIAVLSDPLYYYIQNNSQDTLSTKKRSDKYDIAVKICRSVKCFYREIEKCEEQYKKADSVINTRLILEFLDEIEGLAYDKAMSRGEKLRLIERYMNDSYIINANKSIENIQIDYRIINFFFRRKCKHIVFILIYVRRLALKAVRHS